MLLCFCYRVPHENAFIKNSTMAKSKRLIYKEAASMKFRPCIDLHEGVVKQIVGSTLSDDRPVHLATNFQAEKSPEWFAQLYKKDGLDGGHVIMLGPGNEDAARNALSAWPGGLQIGGGIHADNASAWIDAGASAVIVTSFVFHDGVIDEDRLNQLVRKIGKDRLVLDLSCRWKEDKYIIVTNRWQTFTSEAISFDLLDRLAAFCSEFLIHAVDVEGKMSGIETDLVRLIGRWNGIPVTYAGGIRSLADIRTIQELGQERIDFTVGSALDIFGGDLLKYDDLARQYAPR